MRLDRLSPGRRAAPPPSAGVQCPVKLLTTDPGGGALASGTMGHVCTLCVPRPDLIDMIAPIMDYFNRLLILAPGLRPPETTLGIYKQFELGSHILIP